MENLGVISWLFSISLEKKWKSCIVDVFTHENKLQNYYSSTLM